MGKKISQLSTDEFLDMICTVTPYVSNIVSDEDLMDTIGKAMPKPKEGVTKAGLLILGLKKLTAILPLIGVKHRNDLYNIISAVTQEDIDSLSKENWQTTTKRVEEIVTDKELMSFFRSFAESEETAS